MTKISWTEQTWNPIVGCSLASPGCTNCYAMAMAARLQCMSDKNPQYNDTTKYVNGRSVWTGKVAMAPDHVLFKPLKRHKPTMYFVNSMGDLFHEDVPDEWIDQVFAVMAGAPQHTFQVLTKRAERMQGYLDDASYGMVPGQSDRIHRAACKVQTALKNNGCKYGAVPVRWPLPNVWLGVSAEDQRRADERVPHLLDTPAAARFISVEPQIEHIDLGMTRDPNDRDRQDLDGPLDYVIKKPGLDWVIQGCESGPGARPFNIDWARSMRDQCVSAGVPYFLKQSNDVNGKLDRSQILDGIKHDEMPAID